ncbi:MAG: succinate dehydrogenase, cytochrome b556 subunit [Rhodospirillales bacterium CG15_BIG_FIL_POST_REV_8_21_14_020_66_15]|nr:MAG: succinate dehydrogenase, cytochrome b556 subunit [Rhodospirillales bacterium CG15_BIG_FIL_POST_REV_8_21_14_020_66_15]
MARRERPLSPHLQVYRPQITSMLSIVHRMTGVALTAGILVLTYWLSSATYGAEAFATAQVVMGSWIGQVVLWGLVFALFYHLSNGIRHMLWDTGRYLDMSSVRSTGYIMVAAAVILTVATIAAGYGMLRG